MKPEVRDSASIFLYRPVPNSAAENEVFLARRSPDASFFPAYYAFIGGTLEEEDKEEGEERMFQHCALRELFEETGVLLCTPPPDPNSDIDLSHKRNELLSENLTFTEFLSEIDASPDYNALNPAGRLLTPDFVPVRYDTRFFAAPLPDRQNVHIKKGELTEGDWFTPSSALDRWNTGEIKIAPPQILYLRILRDNGFSKGLQKLQKLDTSGTDREPYIEIRPGLRFLPLKTPTLPPSRTINTCIVGTDPFVVVDPGTPHKEERNHLKHLLDNLQREGNEFSKILLTHHHPDHVAGADWLRKKYDVSIGAHPLTAEKLSGTCDVDTTIHNGDSVETGMGPLSAIHTPGHTPGHLAFLVENLRALLAGDVVAGMGTVLIDPPEGDMKSYMETLKDLTKRDLDLLIPAHGPFTDRPSKLLDHYIKHRKMREQKVLHALETDRERTLDDLLPEVYEDVDRDLWKYARRSLLAHLLKLEQEGRASQNNGWKAIGKSEITGE